MDTTRPVEELDVIVLPPLGYDFLLPLVSNKQFFGKYGLSSIGTHEPCGGDLFWYYGGAARVDMDLRQRFKLSSRLVCRRCSYSWIFPDWIERLAQLRGFLGQSTDREATELGAARIQPSEKLSLTVVADN